MNTTTRTALLSLSILLAGTALTGCTITVSDPPATDSAAPRAAAGATPSTSSTPSGPTSSGPTPSTPAAEEEPTTSVPRVDDERLARLHRTTWADAVTQHLTCTGGTVTVDRNADAMVVEVAGDCRDVTINAVAATVLLPAVGRVTVDTDGSIVIVESADEIVLGSSADANLVGWERGTPVVRDTGVMNATTPIS